MHYAVDFKSAYVVDTDKEGSPHIFCGSTLRRGASESVRAYSLAD